MLIEQDLTERVIGAAIEVHREIGPGVLESAYAVCMRRELDLRAIRYEFEVPLPVVYKGVHLDCGYRMDLVIEGKLVVELKAVASILPIHEAQLLTYLRLSRLPVGLLTNFNGPTIRNNFVHRVL